MRMTSLMWVSGSRYHNQTQTWKVLRKVVINVHILVACCVLYIFVTSMFSDILSAWWLLGFTYQFWLGGSLITWSPNITQKLLTHWLYIWLGFCCLWIALMIFILTCCSFLISLDFLNYSSWTLSCLNRLVVNDLFDQLWVVFPLESWHKVVITEQSYLISSL